MNIVFAWIKGAVSRDFVTSILFINQTHLFHEFLSKTILACLSGAQMASIHEIKKCQKILWHCPFKHLKMVAKRHKITNVPLFKKIWDIIFFWGQSLFEPFLGTFWGGLDFFGPPQKVPWNSSKKNCPAKKNYVPQFLKQRYINSYNVVRNLQKDWKNKLTRLRIRVEPRSEIANYRL